MKKLFVYFLFITVLCQYSWGSTTGANSPKKLANGMTVETYRIKKSFDFKGKKSICDKSEFDYEIEWPIDGPQPLLNKCRKWILQQLNDKEDVINGELSSNSLRLAIEERIKNNSPSYDLEYDASEGVVEDRIIIRIKADEVKTCLSSHIEELWCGAPRTDYIDKTYNMLNNGEEMTYSMFPPIEKMRPYLWKYMKCFGDPCEVWEYPELEEVQYPKNLPVITENGIEFIWDLYEVLPRVQFTSEVPYSDILRVINKEGLDFIPQAAIEDFKKNSNGDLNKETLLLYAKDGVANDKNNYISHEFAEVLRLIDMAPTDNPGGISSYWVVYWDWTGDGESDCDDTGFKDAEIISKRDNSAKGILKYKTCGGSFNRFNVDLVKEKFVYPSGLEEIRWVVDDYDNKKAKIIAEINEAGKEFSNGLGQRLMNDPDESGFMSAAEKREYLQQVDEFLKAYKKYKSGETSSNIAPTVDKVFEGVEQPAEFPGGQAALMKWLSNIVKYPVEAQKEGIQGRVLVRMVIEKDGSISNPTVIKGVRGDLDEEAVRVVTRMPKWQPGKNNGQAVRSYFTLPISFKLPAQEAK